MKILNIGWGICLDLFHGNGRCFGVMKREWEIVVETVTAVAAGVFLVLQIYYGFVYESSVWTILYHLLPLGLLYMGLVLLQMFPEMLNGSSEPLPDMVRIYAVRMIRISKLLFVFGMLVPSIADVLGIEMNSAYSLVIMGGILGTIGYYFYRIFQYNSRHKK